MIQRSVTYHLLVAARKAETKASNTKTVTAKAGVLGGNHNAEIGGLTKQISTLRSMMQGKNEKGQENAQNKAANTASTNNGNKN